MPDRNRTDPRRRPTSSLQAADVAKREAALYDGEERFRTLVQNIPDYAIFLLDINGVIIEWNEGAERVKGYTAEEVVGQHVSICYTPEQIAAGQPEKELAEAAREGRIETEGWRVRKGGERFWVHEIATAIRDTEGRVLGYTKITRDLTERKRVVKALHASEQRFRAMFEQSPVPKWIFHPQTLRFLDVNEAAVRQYGYSREEFLAMTIREIRPAEEIERFDRALLRRSIGVGTVQLGGFKHRRKDGSLLDVEITTQSIEYAGQSAVLVLAFDVTERRQAEAALRQLNETLEHRVEARTAELERTTRVLAREIEEREYAEVARGEVLRQLVSAEEEERRRISRELHDQMGQQVTGLLLGLRVLRDTHEGARSEKLDELETLADQIARDMQAMALELRPPALDTLGLVAALQSHLAEWAERHGLAHDFHAHGLDGERLSAEMETTLYRIVQEGLTNTIKHAGATRVSLLLERGRGEIRAVLEDNGRGFDVEQTLASPENARRLGLRGMRERVALLGGEMEIESSPGGGTALFVRLPDADAHPPAEGEGPA